MPKNTKTAKPTVYLVFDPLTTRYLDHKDWTAYAEDAVEYPSYEVAMVAVAREGKKLGHPVEVVLTASHYRS